MPRMLSALALIPFFALSLFAADKPSKADLVKLGKAATALVEIDKRGLGSAFCVHTSGLFVTNEHVVEGAESKVIQLVLDSSLKTQRVLKAKVVRVDKKLDLALLRAEEPGELTALALGSIDDAVELADLIAFGFPFGKGLSTEKDEYPAISVNAGTVTALRLKDKELDRIQMDVALNPGNSGGAVIDDRGRVLGIVVSGITRGARINFAIPVSHLDRFLRAPDIQFKAPELTTENLNKPLEYKAKAVSILPDAKIEPTLKLILRAGEGEPREFPMKKVQGEWIATTVAVNASGSGRIEIAAKLGTSTISGTVDDAVFKVGGKPVRLSGVRRVVFSPKPKVILADGKNEMEGEITQLGVVELELGGQKLKIDLAKASEVTVQSAAEVFWVLATVVASVDGKEVARVETKLIVRDPSKLAPADPSKVVITAPELADDKVVKKLPEAFKDVVVGGGGRYLIFHLPKLKKLAIFDVNTARVTKYLALEEDDVSFAAGLDSLVIGLKQAGKLERWSLTTFEREKSAASPFKETIGTIYLGHASNGPLVVNGYFLDLASFRTLPILDGNRNERIWGASDFRIPSADGTVFGAWNTRYSPDTATTFVLEGETVKRYDSGGLHHVAPGPDGKTVYTAKGIASGNLSRGSKDDETYGYCLPAVRGDYFLSLTTAQQGKGGGYMVYLRGLKEPIAKLDKADHGLTFDTWDRDAFGPWKRVFLIPDAKVIAVLPSSNDQIVLHKFDAEAALEKSGQSYLIVTSRPPASAKPGTTLTYPIVVKSKDAKLEFKLDSGPAGMEVSATGKLTWAVPADAKPGDYDVILTIRDGTGQEVFHTFAIRVAK